MSVEDTNMKETYGITFNTKNASGLIRVTKITIEEDLMDDDDVVRVDLADHPLYKDLQSYVRSNKR